MQMEPGFSGIMINVHDLSIEYSKMKTKDKLVFLHLNYENEK